MGRAILAVVAGCVLSVLVVFAMDALSHQVYPPPAGLDVRDPAAMRTIIAGMPTGAFIIVVAGWILGAGLGSWLATRLSTGKAWAGGAVGGVTLAVTGMNLFTIPHPVWVIVTALIGIPLGSWFGTRAARTSPPAIPTARAA
jgi:hypothetical protein